MIPTASMADIAFLLIIFFMVTTVHEVDRTSVQLPVAKIREEAEKGSAIVVVHKNKEGDIAYKFSDGEVMSQAVGGPEDIYLEASRLTYVDKTKQFILKADGDIHFEKVDELLDQMRRGGVQKVLLLTQQKTD
ncbi:MAG TPA: biopolymer transporter ExbD [Candidatus Polarisedimenticolaceae bacterium]|nr:biopolymer transporter ExbD [Candidatus Polarisedimenticolaceae bacterium]